VVVLYFLIKMSNQDPLQAFLAELEPMIPAWYKEEMLLLGDHSKKTKAEAMSKMIRIIRRQQEALEEIRDNAEDSLAIHPRTISAAALSDISQIADE